MLTGDPMERIPIWNKMIIPAILLVMVLAVPALAGTVIPDNVSNANPDFITAANETVADADPYGNDTVVTGSENTFPVTGEAETPDPETPAANPAESNPPAQIQAAGATIELPRQNGLNLTVINKQRPGLYDSEHPGTYFFNIGNNMYNGGQNAIHISDSYLTADGTITVSDSPTGTFYVTDTGGKGYEDEAILLIAVQENELSEDFSIDLAVEGYRFLDHAANVAPTADEVGDFNSEAYAATLNASDFLTYDGALVSQAWKPSTGSAGDVNMKFFDGQDLAGPKYNLILVDLNTSIVGRNAAYQTTLTNYGNPKVTYTIHGYSGGNVSFAPYAYVSYQTGGGSAFDRTVGWASRSSTNSWLVTLEEAGTAPVADFSADVTSGEVPLAVQFTDASSGTPTSWAWDFENDGVVDSTEQSPSFTYTAAGTYTVNLTVANAAGSNTTLKTDLIAVTSGGSVGPGGNATIALLPGWNFVSTPKRLADGANTIAIFDAVDTADHSILLYNGTGGWEAMSSQEAFEPLDGIWIYANGTYEIPLTFAGGSVATPPTKDLDEGWNAVGFSDTVAASAAEALLSVDGAWTTLFGFDAGMQSYDVSIINGATGRHGDDRTMNPTQGYWLYMNEAGTLAAIGA